MSKWMIKVEPFQEVVFEVLETDTKWDPYAIIEASPGRQYELCGQVGDRVTVEFNTGESVVTFEPYARDEAGKASASCFRCFNEPETRRCWRLDTEAGEGVDWNDYVVRIHVVDAAPESVELFRQSLKELECDVPTIRV